MCLIRLHCLVFIRAICVIRGSPCLNGVRRRVIPSAAGNCDWRYNHWDTMPDAFTEFEAWMILIVAPVGIVSGRVPFAVIQVTVIVAAFLALFFEVRKGRIRPPWLVLLVPVTYLVAVMSSNMAFVIYNMWRQAQWSCC